jgi:hypothetical protein
MPLGPQCFIHTEKQRQNEEGYLSLMLVKHRTFLISTFIIFFSKLGFMLSSTTNDDQLTDERNELIDFVEIKFHSTENIECHCT